MARKRLGELLIEAGALDEARLSQALAEQKRRPGAKIGRILVGMRVISEETLLKVLSAQLQLPIARLEGQWVPAQVLGLLSRQACEQHGVFPFAITDDTLDVAMVDPLNQALLDGLRVMTGLPVRPHLADPRAIGQSIAHHYSDPEPIPEIEVQGDLDSQSFAPRPPSAPRLKPARPGLAAPINLDDVAAPEPPPEPPKKADRRDAGKTMKIATLEGRVAQLERDNAALREQLAKVEALITRDEDVLRKLMGVLIASGVCTREQLLDYLRQK